MNAIVEESIKLAVAKPDAVRRGGVRLLICASHQLVVFSPVKIIGLRGA